VTNSSSSPPSPAEPGERRRVAQYTLHPGRRDDLIALFDREQVESQEACGIELLRQFRDLDDPDRPRGQEGST
jgi:hypothetical protein